MDRFDHRVVGVTSGLAVAAVGHWSVPQAVAGAVCAWATSAGAMSPDMDQKWQADRKPRYRRTLLEVLLRQEAPGRRVPLRWRLARRGWLLFARVVSLAPWWRRERGQHGDPSQHRGITHFWGVPVLAALLLGVAQTAASGLWWWLAWAAIAGWTSHLVPGDWLFGRQVYGQDDHGIPLCPWWGHAGFTLPGKRLRRRGWPIPVAFRSAGWAAHVFAVGGAVPASVWLAAVIAHL